jgi:hypothetical protein
VNVCESETQRDKAIAVATGEHACVCVCPPALSRVCASMRLHAVVASPCSLQKLCLNRSAALLASCPRLLAKGGTSCAPLFEHCRCAGPLIAYRWPRTPLVLRSGQALWRLGWHLPHFARIPRVGAADSVHLHQPRAHHQVVCAAASPAPGRAGRITTPAYSGCARGLKVLRNRGARWPGLQSGECTGCCLIA